jgi:hypothetical protein
MLSGIQMGIVSSYRYRYSERTASIALSHSEQASEPIHQSKVTIPRKP